MYKSVNLSSSTYQKLQKISTQLNKPKAQIVESLITEFSDTMKVKEKTKLEKFNKEMGARIKTLKFTRKIKVNTDNIDEDFAALAKTDYTG